MAVTKEGIDVLTIDEHQLHVEWINQPRLFGQYAEMLANKRAELDSAKARFDVVVAELDRDIRKMPESYGISKVTESAVEKTVVLQVKHFKALERVNNLKHEVAIVQAMVDALDHRKKALENLVILHCQNYWGEPRLPRGEARDRIDGEVKREVRTRGRNR